MPHLLREIDEIDRQLSILVLYVQ